MVPLKRLGVVLGAAVSLVSLSLPASAQGRDSYPSEERMFQRGPYDQGYGDPRGRRENYSQQYDGDRRDEDFRRYEGNRRGESERSYERDRRDANEGRNERDQRGSGAALQQQVQAAQVRHNQGVVALQQQFNQHQISRAQMDAEIRNLEVRMNGEIQQAQRR